MIRSESVSLAAHTKRSLHKMKLDDLLKSLDGAERDFIAGLDYGNDQSKHRSELDSVIENNGIVDFEKQGFWHPYEVIELGKNDLKPNHEREYAACMGIVLKNIGLGTDQSNDVESIIENQSDNISMLPFELKVMLEELIK